MDSAVVGDLHHGFATRDYRAVRSDDRPSFSHNILEHEEATRQD
jgi:hypothetical protein